MTSLYVDRRGITLEVDAGALVFREQGERIGTVPIAPLSRVFLRGDVTLTASVLGHLGAAGVGVVLLSGRFGRPTLFLPRLHHDAARRLAQWAASQAPEVCLRLAQRWVEDKIRGQVGVLHAYLARRPDQRYALHRALETLRPLLESPPGVRDLAALRGREGAAAHAYFQGLAAIAPAGLDFEGRNRRPPRDPLNAVLSLSYTLLHAEVTLALHGAGLDPYVGFFHSLDFARESLSCDVIEPLRPALDQFVLGLFESRQLREEDFSVSEQGCLLGKAGRARFYAAYEQAGEARRRALRQEVAALLTQLGQSAVDEEEAPCPLI